MSCPEGLAVDQDTGHVYVGDACWHRVVELDENLAYVRRWGRRGGDGSSGNGPGEFNLAIGLAIGPDGTVNVADFQNHRLQAFDAPASWLRTLGGPGTILGTYDLPRYLTFDRGGELLVGDTYNTRVQAIDPLTGAGAWSFGAPTASPAAGKFAQAEGVAADPTGGSVLVADPALDTLQVFHVPVRRRRRADGRRDRRRRPRRSTGPSTRPAASPRGPSSSGRRPRTGRGRR